MDREQKFELLTPITAIETIAVNRSIQEPPQLQRRYGRGRWRKLKGWAVVRLEDGRVVEAELHWYEASGIGRRRMKIKRVIE